MSSAAAVLFASTYNQLFFAQAAVLRADVRYSDVWLVWFGPRPFTDIADLLVVRQPAVRVIDCSRYGRFKLWRPAAGRLHRALTEQIQRELDPPPQPPIHVYLGNESELLPQAVMRMLGLGWGNVTLYEEGLGFYAGSDRHAEKAALNLLLRLRGHPYREFHRNFSRNPRIERVACNHPALVADRRVETLDVREAYREVVEAAAKKVRERGPDGTAAPVACAYVSCNLVGTRQMRLSEELAMLERIHEAMAERLAPVVHIKFHPREPESKRRAALSIGFREIEYDGPFEIAFLLRRYMHVCSVRSSVMLNLAVLGVQCDQRLVLIRSERRPYQRLYRRRVAQVFDHLVHAHPAVSYFDPWATQPAHLSARG